jgi:formylglycine-generating enzyme required for sulfatase activity
MRSILSSIILLSLSLPALAGEREWVKIKAGSFLMGSSESEEPRFEDETQHEVTLTRGFFIQTTEVTQGQWKAIMGSNPSSTPACGAECPVDMVSWLEAISYMNALSESEGYESCYEIKGTKVSWTKGYSCNGYRLPTEAEWEYAVRAGSTATRYGEIDDISWYEGNSDKKTQRVGQMEPNDWGLYDMHGNVWEWVWDRYEAHSADAVTDPTGASKGKKRVRKGGSCTDFARHTRAAYRQKRIVEDDIKRQGLRPVRTVKSGNR